MTFHLPQSAMPGFLHIRTDQFPVLPSEDDESVNPGTYGKAFAMYLHAQLTQAGYRCPLVCCEDWGWWVSVELKEKTIGLTCYREHDQAGDCSFVCGTSPASNKRGPVGPTMRKIADRQRPSVGPPIHVTDGSKDSW